MKLKVICQRCGKTGVVDTTTSSGWNNHVVNRVVGGLASWMDWEFWLCPECDCDHKISEDGEFFDKILEIGESEFEEVKAT